MPLDKSTIIRMQQIVNDLHEELVEFRQDLHRHPELSWEEFRTTAKIREMLASRGIDNFATPLPSGGVVDMVFREGAPFIMFRADIDALPIQDKKEVPYRSQQPGICHACAHDAHTATALGVALAARTLDLPARYNFRFVFQPAEEPIPSGAPKMIEAGVLKDVKYVIGLHMEPRLPLGTVGIAPGWINMSSNRIDLVLRGTGGHSARPGETADLLWLASRIILDSYQMVYRRIDLRDSPVILTFTEIAAGEGYNIIPGELKLTGTLRLVNPVKYEQFMHHFRNYLKSIENESGCRIDLQVQNGAPAIYNHPDLMKKLHENTEKDFWLPVKLNHDFITPGGDDFSYYSKQVPGAMVRIGVRTDEMTSSLHDGSFDVHPEAIRTAVAYFLHQLYHLED